MAVIAGTIGAMLFGTAGAVALVAFSVFAGLLGGQLGVEHIMHLHRGRELLGHTVPQLVQIVRRLTQQAGLKAPPRLFSFPVSNSTRLRLALTGTAELELPKDCFAP